MSTISIARNSRLPSETMDEHERLDKQQTAAYLGCSVAWLNTPERRRVLPDGVRFGKKKYWFKRDLDAYIQARRHEEVTKWQSTKGKVPETTGTASNTTAKNTEARLMKRPRGRPKKQSVEKESELSLLLKAVQTYLEKNTTT